MDIIFTDDKFPPGKMKLLKKLGKGVTASAYLCRFTKKYNRLTQVVKITALEDDIIYCQDGRGLDHRDLVDGNEELIWTTQPHFKDGAELMIRTCSWRLERIVGRELQCVNARLPCPIFLPIYQGWTYKLKRYVTMPFAGEVIADLILPLSSLISIVIQVLVGLCWAQKICQFKHHDLHSENVFVQFRKVPKVWPLPDGSSINLPDTGVQAVIADYGQSAITKDAKRFSKADTNDLKVDDGKWGTWNSILQGNEGYDMAVFLNNLQADCQEPANRIFLDALEAAAKSIKFYRMSSYGRPYGKVGVNMLKLLNHPIFECCR
jgi:hypothetical protein